MVSNTERICICDKQRLTPNTETASDSLFFLFFFYQWVISLLFETRGRENQRHLMKHKLVSRETPSGEKYLEMRRERGAVLAPKTTKVDESNDKIFERPGSKRCPVKLTEKHLSHVNPECSSLFTKPQSPWKSFNPARDAVW